MKEPEQQKVELYILTARVLNNRTALKPKDTKCLYTQGFPSDMYFYMERIPEKQLLPVASGMYH